MTADVVFMKHVARCSTCETGSASAQADGLWLCADCYRILVPTPAPVQALVRSPEPREARPSLKDIINTVLRDAK
jgi:ribosomal protein L37AE/L43A